MFLLLLRWRSGIAFNDALYVMAGQNIFKLPASNAGDLSGPAQSNFTIFEELYRGFERT